MKLTGYEMETIILYNQAEPNAQVYTPETNNIEDHVQQIQVTVS